jgi:hypothetical protein
MKPTTEVNSRLLPRPQDRSTLGSAGIDVWYLLPDKVWKSRIHAANLRTGCRRAGTERMT